MTAILGSMREYLTSQRLPWKRAVVRESSYSYYLVIKMSKGLDEYVLNAAATGDLNAVIRAVERGANIHTCCGEEEAPLIVAAGNGHLNVISYLLAQGADVNAQDGEALISAAMDGHLSVVKYLVSQGADVNAQRGRALIIAAREGRLSVVRYLLSLAPRSRAEILALMRISNPKDLDTLEYLLSLYGTIPSKLSRKMLILLDKQKKMREAITDTRVERKLISWYM
jgi:ankyrin repeat protein